MYFWRDKKRWQGPAKVVKVEGNIVTLTHDERTKTSSLNRVRKTQPPLELLDEIEAEEVASTIQNRQSTHPEKFMDLSPPQAQSSETTVESTPKPRGRPKGSKSKAPDFSNPDLEIRHPKVTRDSPVMTRSRTMRNQFESVSSKRGTNISHDGSFDNTLPFSSIIYCLSEMDSPDAKFFPHPEDNIASYLTGPGTFLTAERFSQDEMRDSYKVEREKWISAEAMDIYKSNEVPVDSNIIGSHVRYVRKQNGTVKARICPWGNHDLDKLNLRCDCPSILMEVLRLLLSIGVEMGWKIGSMDAIAAFLQAVGFNRDIFVKPPPEERVRNILWKLKAAAYGLADSGRLWYLTSNVALCQKFGLKKSTLEPTLYYHKDAHENLKLLVLVQVDNYIYTGVEDQMLLFESFLQSCFNIGSVERGSFHVYGCEIEQDSQGSIKLSQKSKLSEIANMDILPKREIKRGGNDVATPDELKVYRSLLGKILFTGRMSQPVMLRIASEMATKTNRLLVHHLKDLRAQVKYAMSISHDVLYAKSEASGKFYLDIYSDATCSKDGLNSREGFIIFRRLNDYVHPIYWMSRKLRRIARSSSTAEILGASDALDKGLYLSALLKEIHYAHSVDLTNDSKSLFSLATAISEPAESLNKLDLAVIRSSFETGALRRVSWSPGYYLIADALTKNNRETCSLLAKSMREGKYPIHCDVLSRTSPKGEVLS